MRLVGDTEVPALFHGFNIGVTRPQRDMPDFSLAAAVTSSHVSLNDLHNL